MVSQQMIYFFIYYKSAVFSRNFVSCIQNSREMVNNVSNWLKSQKFHFFSEDHNDIFDHKYRHLFSI